MKLQYYLSAIFLSLILLPPLTAQRNLRMDTVGVKFNEGLTPRAAIDWTGSNLYLRNLGGSGGIFFNATTSLIMQSSNTAAIQAAGNVTLSSGLNMLMSADAINLQSTLTDLTLLTERDIFFRANSQNKMVINSGGVGIGMGSPQRILHLQANNLNNFEPQLRMEKNGGYFDFDVGTNFLLGDENGAKFYIDGDGDHEGNIGIGSTGPQRKLHINTFPSAPQLRLQDGFGHFDLYAGTDFQLLDESGVKFFIKGSGATDGNVGIGTTNPQRKLHLVTPAAPQIRLQDNGGFVELYGGADFLVRNFAGTNRLVVQSTGRIFASNLLNIGDFRNMQYNDVTGEIGFDNSSRRDKRNIRDLKENFAVLLNAAPKTYTRPWAPDRWEIGFIAEDFHDLGLIPLVEYDQTGHPDGIRYDKIVTYLVPLLQQQQQSLDDKTEKIRQLEQEMQELRQDMELIKQYINNQPPPSGPGSTGQKEIIDQEGDAYLQQNAPNPFSTSTIIRYSIPAHVQRAELHITDVGGQTIKRFTISSRGTGHTDLEVQNLGGGSYFYSLILDGAVFATKKMVFVN